MDSQLPQTLEKLDKTTLWEVILQRAQTMLTQEPDLARLIQKAILDHQSFAQALSFQLAYQLGNSLLPAENLQAIIEESYAADAGICQASEIDLQSTYTRDAACDNYLTPLLFFKGYQALQAYRVSHWLWHRDRKAMALYMQSLTSARLDVDIHPAARIGRGVTIDHASGVVIGETAVIGDNVSLLQGVTLGGTGKEVGDRHPKVHSGVLISAGAKILGNIQIGYHAKVGAGSVVLKKVEAHTTVAGVPAVKIGQSSKTPALTMDHTLEQDKEKPEQKQ